jgi:HAE1 family hydrophobic/amphiphilic exporter-1
VFLPLVFVQGIAGQLFRDQALTVAIAIAVSLVVAMTLIPMLSALKGRPPLGFPDEPGQPSWQPTKTWQKPAKYAGRGAGGLFRWTFFGIAWLVVRVWRGISAVVGPVMRKASDIAMSPYGRAERGYLRLLPAALHRPKIVLLAAGGAFALALLVVPMLGADLIPQLAQDRFEMTVKLPPGTPLRDTDAAVRMLQRRR